MELVGASAVAASTFHDRTQGKLGDFRPRQSVLHALARSPLLRAPCHRPDRVASVATRTQDVRACKQWLQHPQQSETQLMRLVEP